MYCVYYTVYIAVIIWMRAKSKCCKTCVAIRLLFHQNALWKSLILELGLKKLTDQSVDY